MIEAQANVVLGEAIRPAAAAHKRVYSGGIRLVLLPALALAGAIVLSSLLGRVLTLISLRLEGYIPILWVAGGVLGLLAALRILSNQHLRGFLDGLRRMGTPEIFLTRFRFDETAIHVDSGRLSHRAPWTCVLFVMPSSEHWLVQADTTTLAIPRRAFADSEAESAFLELAAERLTSEARKRSVLARQ